MKKCPNGHDIPDKANFCDVCGADSRVIESTSPDGPAVASEHVGSSVESSQAVATSRSSGGRGKLLLGVAAAAVAVVAAAVTVVTLVGSGSDEQSAAETVASKSPEPPPTKKSVTAASAVSYRQLFKAGHTTVSTAKPACGAYKKVIQNWTQAASFFDSSSSGADEDEWVASDYALTAKWITKNEAAAYDVALRRISRRSLAGATRGAQRRESFVDDFQADALYACKLGTATRETRDRLTLLDLRAADINSLAASKPWYPRGWNSYDDNLAWRWNNNAACDAYSDGCWHMDVITQNGCDNLYAELTVLEDGVVVGYTNDLASGVHAGETALLTFNATSENAQTGRLKEINCY